MTGCRASALAIALAIGLTTAAAAQVGAPLRLIPGGDTLPPPSVPREQGVRDEGLLRPLDAGAAGILDAASGALPATLWSGSSRKAVDPLLAGVAAARLPTLRDVTRRALASGGAPPAREGDATLPDFAAARARGLLRLGDAAGARQLAERVMRNQGEDTARAVLRDVLLLADDPGPGCALIREAIAEFTDPAATPDWYRALIACQTLAGDIARAQLGMTVLREQNVEEDDWLDRLVAHADGAKKALDGGRAELRAHHIPLFAAAKTAPPATIYPGASPALLAAIARNPAFALEARLRAAEPAVTASALDGGELAALYEAATPNAREAADPLAFAEREAGPRARAALFKALKAQATDADRAQLLGRAMALAERRGAGAAFRLAAVDLAAAIAPSREAAPHAGVVARVLLADGRVAEAMRWHDLVRPGSGHAEIGAMLAPLLFLAGGVDRNFASSEALAAWREAQQASAPARAGARTRLLGELLEALAMPSAELAGAGPAQAVSAPALLIRLERAAAQRHVGETVLLASAVMQEPALRDNPTAIAAVVRGLREIGLPAEARVAALEAALAAGL